jgi:hypothetical protein
MGTSVEVPIFDIPHKKNLWTIGSVQVFDFEHLTGNIRLPYSNSYQAKLKLPD